MRTRIPTTPIAALASLVLMAAGARAQDAGPATPPGTIAGVVTDSMTGLPVVEAAVSLEAGRAVLTDSGGHFQLKGTPKEGQVSVAVDQLGYAPFFAMVDVAAPAVAVRLVPDSAVLRGLKNIDAELRHAVGISGNTRFFGRSQLLTANARDLRDFLIHHGAYAPVRPPYPRGPDDLLQPGGGGPAQPIVYIDGSAFPGLSSLPTYYLPDLYAVVLANGGAYIMVWSNAYIERLARNVGHFR